MIAGTPSPPAAQGPRRALRIDDVFAADLCGRLRTATLGGAFQDHLCDPLLLGATATCIGRRVLPAVRAAFGARLSRITTPWFADRDAAGAAPPGAAGADDQAFAIWVMIGAGRPRLRLPGQPPFALPLGAALVTAPGVPAAFAPSGPVSGGVLRALLFDEATVRARQAAAATQGFAVWADAASGRAAAAGAFGTMPASLPGWPAGTRS